MWHACFSVLEPQGVHVVLFLGQWFRLGVAYTYCRHCHCWGGPGMVCIFVKERGVAKQIELGRDRWQLTDAGFAAIRVSQPLKLDGPVLKRRPDVPTTEASVFELLTLFHDNGWCCRVFVPAKRGDKLEPYTVGKEKVAWAKPTQKLWSSAYLQALLLSEKHRQEVPPFRSERFYMCLLGGETFSARRRKPKGNGECEFRFGSEVDVGVGLPEHVATSASSDSSSSSSDTSSSSSDSSSSDEEKETLGPEDLGLDACGPLEEEPLLMEGATNFWKGFKFTPTFDAKVVQTGWEVTCYMRLHRDATACRRRRNFSHNGGPAQAERLLKHWCINALEYGARVDHRDAPDAPLEELPTLAELERREAPDKDFAEPVARRPRT